MQKGQYETTALGGLIEVLVIIGLFLLAYNYIDNKYSDETYERGNIATDSAFLMETVQASPGNLIKNYNQNSKSFTISFEKNNVKVSGKGSELSSYRFIENNYLIMHYATIDAKEIKFSNNGRDIYVVGKDKEIDVFPRHICKAPKKQGMKHILLLDPLKGTESMLGYFKTDESSKYFIDVSSEKLTDKQRHDSLQIAILYIVIDRSYALSKDTALIRATNSSNLALGCYISNRLNINTNIVIDKDNELLNTKQPGVMITLGEQTKDVSEGIFYGIRDYYG